MGRNKGLSRDDVVKSLKRQLTEYDIDDIPTDAIRHLQMARIICECNYVFLDDVIETLANWLKMDTGEIPKGAISLLQDALDACRGTAPHKRRKVSKKVPVRRRKCSTSSCSLEMLPDCSANGLIWTLRIFLRRR